MSWRLFRGRGAGCSPPAAPPVAHNTGVYLLVDTSGFVQPAGKTRQSRSSCFALSRLQPLDSFAVARIDTASFTEKNIIAKGGRFDDRPSTANSAEGERSPAASRSSSMSRGPRRIPTSQAACCRRSSFSTRRSRAARRFLIFSDMKEELAKGLRGATLPLDFKGFEVVALNVTKLRLRQFRSARIPLATRSLARARGRERGGGHWRVVNDLDRLDGLL